VQILLNLVGANLADRLFYVSIAYDWVNDRMSSNQKQTVVNWLVSIAGTTPQLSTDFIRLQRSPQPPKCIYPGLAFYGDGINDQQAQSYVNFIPSYLAAVRALDHEAGQDGGIPLGLCYGQYQYMGASKYRQHLDFYLFMTATNLTVNDTFNAHQYMKEYRLGCFMDSPGLVSQGSLQSIARPTLTKLKTVVPGSGIW